MDAVLKGAGRERPVWRTPSSRIRATFYEESQGRMGGLSSPGRAPSSSVAQVIRALESCETELETRHQYLSSLCRQ